MVEYFVHLDVKHPPQDLVLATAAIPQDVSMEQVSIAELPSDWRRTPAPLGLAAIGERFVRDCRSAVLIVPSAISPTEFNWLLNPAHPDMSRLAVEPLQDFLYDSRFFR